MAKKPTGSTGSVEKVLEMIKEHGVEYVDLRFTDPRGKWQHTAQHISTIDEDAFRDGIMFDGSSIAGWKVPKLPPVPNFTLSKMKNSASAPTMMVSPTPDAFTKASAFFAVLRGSRA